jgi:hypothetical protein
MALAAPAKPALVTRAIKTGISLLIFNPHLPLTVALMLLLYLLRDCSPANDPSQVVLMQQNRLISLGNLTKSSILDLPGTQMNDAPIMVGVI